MDETKPCEEAFRKMEIALAASFGLAVVAGVGGYSIMVRREMAQLNPNLRRKGAGITR